MLYKVVLNSVDVAIVFDHLVLSCAADFFSVLQNELFFLNFELCQKLDLLFTIITNRGLYTPAPDSPRSLKSSGSGRTKRSPKFPRYLFFIACVIIRLNTER